MQYYIDDFKCGIPTDMVSIQIWNIPYKKHQDNQGTIVLLLGCVQPASGLQFLICSGNPKWHYFMLGKWW